MDLAALKSFVSVVHDGSFAAAARTTGVPKSTLSKRVQDLEADLGQRLLERTTRKLRLTPEGALLFERAQWLITEAQEIEHLVRDRDQTPRGRLRVAAPLLFGQAFLGPIAAKYVRRYPAAGLDIVFADRQVDLIEENFDCAIRVGDAADSSQIKRTFAESTTRLVAANDIARDFAALTHPRELPARETIGFAPTGQIAPWELVSGEDHIVLRFESRLTLSSFFAVRDAAIAGGGIALVPSFLVDGDLRSGALVEVLADWHGPSVGLSVVYPSRRLASARLRAFIDLLTARFADRQLG